MVVGVHHIGGIVGVSQSERMAGFVQDDAENVDVQADFPVLVGIQMEVARDRFGIRRKWVKGVCEHASEAVERIRIAMAAAREKHAQRPGTHWIAGWSKRQL